jgi:hypothetical protein
MTLDEKFLDAIATRSERMAKKKKKTAKERAADSAHDHGVSPDLAGAITKHYETTEPKPTTTEGDDAK